jgi:NADH-quinone oxidoreductase subunit F
VIGEINALDLAPLMPVLENYQGRRREALLPLLHEAQSIYGWLPREVQEEIGKTLRVPLADIHGIIEFYSMFYNEPTGRKVIRVCEDLACQLAGASQVKEALGQKLNLSHGQTDEASDITLEYVPCLGMCDQAPAALADKIPVGHINPSKISNLFEDYQTGSRVVIGGEPLLMLSRIGENDAHDLSNYENSGGYEALRRLMDEKPEDIIQLVDESGILGRGGAMFPLGRKWRFTRGTPHEAKHLVINADESEPGTFKDRVIMEGDPFSLIEAATIAGYAVGAENGWIFVRGEYPRSFSTLKNAVNDARDAGYLGKDILGKQGFNFDIEIRLSAGAYICGEETALFEAIEGKRGFPRIKPPFPTTNGLFNQPTAINNVETLVASLAALKLGTKKWREYGTEQSPGTKLFCLSGHVNQPGIYEVPFGKTVRQMIMLAGGVPGGRDIQAVLLGGAAGVFIGPDMLDMRLTYEDSRSNDVPLGSGVIMVFNDQADMRRILRQIGQFFAHESCGKCFPCQIGTQRQYEILDRIASNGAKPTDKSDLLDLGLTMKETSLCGLGQTAGIAVNSAMKLWPEIVE